MRTDPRTVEPGTRLILAAHWLERIGDHATSIAKQARRLAEEPHLKETTALVQMGRLAADQVRGIVSALIDIDDRIARDVAGRDDEIDHLYRKIFADIIDQMRTDPRTVEPGTRLILAAHWLERIGDRVTNIGEAIVYLATGSIEDLNP
jgi:phosphate transport system protein